MLTDVKVRFFDEENHKLGFVYYVSVIDQDQAERFAEDICEQIRVRDNDWSNEEVFWEIVK